MERSCLGIQKAAKTKSISDYSSHAVLYRHELQFNLEDNGKAYTCAESKRLAEHLEISD